MNKDVQFGLFFIGALLFLFPTWAAAQIYFEDDETLPRWSGEIEFGLVFDDNIFQDKENRVSDEIIESSILLNARMGETMFSALGALNRYRENKNLTHYFYEVGLETPLEDEFYFSAFLTLAPSAPLDKEDRSRQPFELSSSSISLYLDREMTWGEAGVYFSWTRLNYNADFNAKDSQIMTLGPTLFYTDNVQWAVSSDLALERGEANRGTLVVQCPLTSEAVLRTCRNLLMDEGFTCGLARCRRGDDISYRAVIFSIQIRYEVLSTVQVLMRYRFKHKRFSADESDPIHFGRRDKNHWASIEAVYKPFPNLMLRSGLEEMWTRSTDPFVEFNEKRFIFSSIVQF